MTNIKRCSMTLLIAFLLTTVLVSGTQAAASASNSKAAGSSDEKVPGPSGYSVFDLTFEDGVPVLADYTLQGFKLKPVIDSGNSGALAILDKVFTKLHLSEKEQKNMGSAEAGSNKKVQTGGVTANMLGSSKTRWFPAVSMEAMEGASFDSVFPLQVLDADSVAFLISRSELWTYNLGPDQASLSDNPAVKSIPYSNSPSGLEIWISCGGERYPAFLDTGADVSIFSLNFAKLQNTLFETKGDASQVQVFNGEESNPSYHLTAGISLLGMRPADDIAIPADDYDTMPGEDFQGKPVPDAELGNPSLLSYKRADIPANAPVALIGMDILSDYDFAINQREKTLYCWSPSETPKLFPKRPKAASKKHAKPKGKSSPKHR